MAVLDWNTFRPKMLMRGLAQSSAAPGYKDPEIERMRGAMLKDTEANVERQDRYDFYQEQDAEETAAKAAAKLEAERMEPIKGESPLQRQTRFQNQSWAPSKYGADYREALKPQAQKATDPAAEEEARRRRRLAMAGRMANAEDEEY
jgi:hypothetical protein